MNDYDKTTAFSGAVNQIRGSLVTIFDGNSVPRTFNLGDFGRGYIYFGRDPRNDIVLNSHLVSAQHGRFIYRGGSWVIEDRAVYEATGSTNGLIYNNAAILAREVGDGDFIRIDDGVETVAEGVLFIFASENSDNRWLSLPIADRHELTIGRDDSCDIVLPHVSVSKCHARIRREEDGFYIADNGSTNGVTVNNERVSGRTKLHEKDVIVITNSKIIYTSNMIFYCCYKSGISVDASDIVITRGRGKKAFVTSNHVTLNVRPGELVAIIGGSGAGKSTILNCMCGYLKPTQGDVYINGINLYQNFDALKKLVGYVPQSDIVYDNLTLYDMLKYTAELRLPKDTAPEEREAAIARAIEVVELTEKKDSYIKSLSGGQRKRASIAVELLSDPNLLYLDEPCSGLDPGTERNLMRSLRVMADNGKTVILVTHSTLQLQMCDKIAFMGKGGNLCFYGSYQEALSFFGISDIVDVYDLITDGAEYWSAEFAKSRVKPGKVREIKTTPNKIKQNPLEQVPALCARYLKLVVNDRGRMLIYMGQIPILAFMIFAVANGNQFVYYQMTKSLLFALSCSAFWMGMLSSIQEICKERTVMRREYMTGLSLSAYIVSKIAVLGLLCLVQSVLITTLFAALIGLPDEGVLLPPYIEMLVTTFLTAVSAAAMGLFVSSLFKNADRALIAAPVLLMPQLLFSGLIFELTGGVKYISWFATCRWSMEGYGTTANLNSLPAKHEAESYYDFSVLHLFKSWGILILFAVVLLLLARVKLDGVKKEKS